MRRAGVRVGGWLLYLELYCSIHARVKRNGIRADEGWCTVVTGGRGSHFSTWRYTETPKVAVSQGILCLRAAGGDTKKQRGVNAVGPDLTNPEDAAGGFFRRGG